MDEDVINQPSQGNRLFLMEIAWRSRRPPFVEHMAVVARDLAKLQRRIRRRQTVEA
jgi:hypothetical protein